MKRMKRNFMQNNLKKALSWIESRTNLNRHMFPVVAKYNGYYTFIAHAYKIKRENKSSLWFIVNVKPNDSSTIYSIRRICTY